MEEFPEKKEADLPQSIIVVLVVLAVAISILGTFTVMSEMSKLKAAPVYKGGSPSGSGQIRLEVQDPNALPSNSATGRIIFEIEKTPR